MLCGSHIMIKIWNLAIHMKKLNKEHQTLSFQFFINHFDVFFGFAFCKISNFNMWTAQHLAQASCTQRPRIDLNKRFLPRPNTTTAWKLIPHRSNISKLFYKIEHLKNGPSPVLPISTRGGRLCLLNQKVILAFPDFQTFLRPC